ncbi:MAG: hypothetical protein ACYTKD_19605 [Planctomycetota bacterium]|jgi:hypothetical protein
MRTKATTRVRLVATVAALALCRIAAAGAVTVEPEVWNYGVRPQKHLVTTTIRFRPSEGLRARIGLVQINCSCLAAKVARKEGTRDAPPEIELTMDTESFEGRTRHYAFVNLEEPERRLVRVEVTGWVRPGPGGGEVEVFFAAEEEAGEGFVEWWRATAADAEGAARVRLLPIGDVANYKRMRELEKLAKLMGPAPDVIAFVDGRIALAGEAEVKAGLAGFLNLEHNGRPGSLHPKGDAPKAETASQPKAARPDAHAAAPVLEAGAATPEVADVMSAAPSKNAPRLEVELYYFSDCRHCREALALVRKIERESGGAVRFTVYDTAATPDAVPRLFSLAGRYPRAPAVLPSMIALVGDEMVAGEVAILREVESVIERQLARGGAHLAIRRPGELTAINLASLIITALADGVNPCAFAAMVLLVSVLSASAMSARGEGPASRAGPTSDADASGPASRAGPTSDADASGPASARRELLLGGGAFVAAVFATYFVAGLALFRGARAIESMVLVERVVFWAVWSLAVAGAALSGWDAIAYFRSGDASRMRLKVPNAIRRRFAGIIRGRFRRSGLVFGGLAAGVVIALLEGVCTGQMYLPYIRYMAGTPGLRARGVSLLLLYNTLFILPLVAILAAAVAGVHFRELNAFLRKHLGGAKVLLAVVFLALAVAMLWQRLAGPALG